MALTQISTDGIKNGTITGTDLATNIDLVNNQKLRLGNNQNLQIYYDNSSYITNGTAGHIIIKTLNTGSDINLECHDDFFVKTANATQNSIIARDSGQVELYYSGNKKFETISQGANVTSVTDAVLQVTTTGTGSTHDARLELITQESTFIIQNDRSLGTDGALTIGDGTDTYLQATKDAEIGLYFNNAKKFETTSYGAKFTDNVLFNNPDTTGRNLTWEADNDALHWEDDTKATFGASNDLEIYHDSSTNIINGLYHPIELRHQSEVHIKCVDDGAVELYHNNSKRFETTSEGTSISGSVTGNAIENATLRFNIINSSGAEKKAQIISTKVADISSTIEFGTTVSHSYDERMRIHSNGLVGIGTSAPVRRLHLHDDSSASNYLAVTNSTTGTSTSDGVLFGLNSAEEAILWNFESTKLKFATAGTERMIIDSSGNVLIGAGSPATTLHINAGSYHAPTGGNDGFTKLIVSNQAAGQGAGIGLLGAGNMVTFIHFGDSDDANVGAIVYNNVVDSMQFYVNAAERMNIDSSGNLNINNDSGKIRVGTHADLEIFHNGSHSYIRDTGTGTLRIETSQMNILRADGAFSIANFVGDGAVKLYFNGGLKFETTNAGIAVSGTLHTQLGFSVNSFNKETTGDQIVFQTTGTTRGSISSNGSTVQFNTSTSDRSMKKNFENWTENTLSLFKNIKPQKFNFITEEDTVDKTKGYIAQDLVDNFPEAYPKNDDDKYVFNPSGMVVYLMKAIQELETEVAALKAS